MTIEFASHNCHYLVNQFVHIDWSTLWRRTLHKPAHPLDNLCRPVALVGYLAHARLDFSHIGRLPAQPPQTGLAVRNDGSKRLSDLVGNRGTEFTKGSHPTRARQFILRLAQLRFGLARVSDVHDRSDELPLVRLGLRLVRDHVQILDPTIRKQ